MKRIQIIGAGQLGSRHLQALKLVQEPLSITVTDPSQDSLRIAKERYDSFQGMNYSVSYQTEILPYDQPWDLVIVSTNASVRRAVIEKVLKVSHVKNFVLEKLLFTDPQDYVSAEKMIAEVGARAWVNCCMRQMPIYKKIQEAVQGQRVNFSVQGSQYGLVTNAIHYFDYMAFLTGSTDFEVDTSGLDKLPIPSKRKGYLEFNGTLVAKFKNGSHGAVTCFPTGNLPGIVEVHTDSQRFVVRESERKAWIASAGSDWKWSEIDAVIPYQSQMTAELVAQIILSDRQDACLLPALSESVRIHTALLEPLRIFLKKAGVNTQEAYPFT